MTMWIFSISICGEGPYRQMLEAQIKRLKLQGRVRFMGYRKDLEVLLRESTFSCFPLCGKGWEWRLWRPWPAGGP